MEQLYLYENVQMNVEVFKTENETESVCYCESFSDHVSKTSGDCELDVPRKYPVTLMSFPRVLLNRAAVSVRTLFF